MSERPGIVGRAQPGPAGPTVYLDAPPAPEPTPLQIALRHKWLIIGFAILVAGAVDVLLQFVTPTYIAEADVRIDMPQVRLLDANASLLSPEQPSLEAVRTELAALSSPKLARSAVDTLGLADLRAFQDCPPDGLLTRLRAAVGRLRNAAPASPPACTRSPELATKRLLQSVSFSNDRSSFIIQITAAAAAPDLAARIANGYAAAYVASQRELKASLAQDADTWLSSALEQMHDKMVSADSAVEAYRQQHKLIGLRRGPADGGSDTLTAQGLEQRNTELSTIEATLVEKSTTLKQMQDALRAGQFDAIAPVLNSPIVQSLLVRHGELVSSLAQLRSSFGPNYPTALSTAAALARNEDQVRQEASKVANSLQGEVAALTARKAAVTAQVAALQGEVAGESHADVKLQELQREAQTDRTLYESLFVRLKQIDAERRLDQANVAVVSEAMPPDAPTAPRKRMMVAGAFLASLGIGAGLAFVREMTSRRFRDAAQLEGEVGLPVVGIFPRRSRAPQDVVVEDPMSMEAEAVHASLAQILGSPKPSGEPLGRTVLITSSLKGEGKSSFCVALGRSAAQSGLSTFILDCDLRRPSIERLISGRRRSDKTLPATRDEADSAGSLLRRAGVDERSGVRYLCLADQVADPHRLFAWTGLSALLRELRARHDLVLLDSPPVLAVSDTLKLGQLADDVLMVIDWRETQRQAVVAALRALQRARVTVAGLVMSKLNLRSYARANGTGQAYERYDASPSALWAKAG